VGVNILVISDIRFGVEVTGVVTGADGATVEGVNAGIIDGIGSAVCCDAACIGVGVCCEAIKPPTAPPKSSSGFLIIGATVLVTVLNPDVKPLVIVSNKPIDKSQIVFDYKSIYIYLSLQVHSFNELFLTGTSF
jgi:hypothetical protein